MRSLNLDTSVYSFGYVAGWAEGGEIFAKWQIVCRGAFGCLEHPEMMSE